MLVKIHRRFSRFIVEMPDGSIVVPINRVALVSLLVSEFKVSSELGSRIMRSLDVEGKAELNLARSSHRSSSSAQRGGKSCSS